MPVENGVAERLYRDYAYRNHRRHRYRRAGENQKSFFHSFIITLSAFYVKEYIVFSFLGDKVDNALFFL